MWAARHNHGAINMIETGELSIEQKVNEFLGVKKVWK